MDKTPKVKPHSRTIVPMNKHKTGLHDGHRKLIKLAQDVGDRVVIPMLYDTFAWYTYLLDDIVVSIPEVDNTEQMREFEQHQVVPWVMPFYEIPLEKRLEWRRKAEGVLQQFYPYLYSPFHQRYALQLTIELIRQIERSKGGVKYAVKGPEWQSFLIKALKPLLGSPVQVIIYPKIEKDPATHIRLQGGVSYMYPTHRQELTKLNGIIAGIRPKLTIGNNAALVQEVNASYRKRPWKLESIGVFEGGIIPGRLESFRFTFPAEVKGTVVIEETNYDSGLPSEVTV